jgi:uncharacterized membrane protein
MTKSTSQILDELISKKKNGRVAASHRVVDSFRKRTPISRAVHEEMDDHWTFGERIADKVAAFGGSWTFIFIFFVVLGSWIILNSFLLARSEPFDPYPYILLNLCLSTLAAIQAPIILMSQNRQAAKDRLAAEHDYEVNLRAELEVRYLHEKLDELRGQRWLELVEMQQKQIEFLEKLLARELPASKPAVATGTRVHEKRGAG